MLRLSHAVFAVIGLLSALPAAAAQIRELVVQRVDARYLVTMEVRLESPAGRSLQAFADYAQLPDINPAVRVARPVDADPSLLYTEVHVCAALLCKTLHQVQRMQQRDLPDGSGQLSAEVLPDRSDLRYGRADWEFTPEGAGTRLKLRMALEPAFWVPPLIGPALIEHSLREEAARTSAGIERLASQASTPAQ